MTITPNQPTKQKNTSDIKPENILLLDDHAHGGAGALGGALKLADLGSCRGMFSRQPYTDYISTRWYR